MDELYRQTNLNAHRVIVAGGRDIDNYEYMSQQLDELFWNSSFFDSRQIKIISGMAEGCMGLSGCRR